MDEVAWSSSCGVSDGGGGDGGGLSREERERGGFIRKRLVCAEESRKNETIFFFAWLHGFGGHEGRSLHVMRIQILESIHADLRILALTPRINRRGYYLMISARISNRD